MHVAVPNNHTPSERFVGNSYFLLRVREFGTSHFDIQF